MENGGCSQLATHPPTEPRELSLSPSYGAGRSLLCVSPLHSVLNSAHSDLQALFLKNCFINGEEHFISTNEAVKTTVQASQ